MSSFSNLVKIALILLLLFAASSCKDMQENMLASGKDKRVANNNVYDFTATDTTGAAVTLSTVMPTKTGTVLYFTMWCPICNGHTDHMLTNLVAKYPNVLFILVDYISADWNQAWANQQAIGYTIIPANMMVVSDSTGELATMFNGTMGMIAVINPAGNMILNQDYQDGVTLDNVLATL